MDAWDLVMRALSHYWRITRQDVVAQALLEKAISIDPHYGQALACSGSHMFGVHMGWTTLEEALPIGERAALAAIRADSEDPWAHHALGSVYLFTRSFDDCLAEFELATRLNPSFAPARGYHGVALAYCGRWEEGDLAARHALRLSPRDPFAAVYCGVVAYCQFVGRNYEEAMRMSREALRQRGDFVGAHRRRRRGDTAAQGCHRRCGAARRKCFAGMLRSRYRSSSMPNASTISMDCAARACSAASRLLAAIGVSGSYWICFCRSVSRSRAGFGRSAHWLPGLIADQIGGFRCRCYQTASRHAQDVSVVSLTAGLVVADHEIAGAQLS
jgi:tetratricopeptide (TPR) repeat protein